MSKARPYNHKNRQKRAKCKKDYITLRIEFYHEDLHKSKNCLCLHTELHERNHTLQS